MVHKKPIRFYVISIDRVHISTENREEAVKLWSMLSNGKYKLIGNELELGRDVGSSRKYPYYGKILEEHDPYSQSGMSMYAKEDVIYDSKQEAQEARDADKAEEKLKEAASKIPVDK